METAKVAIPSDDRRDASMVITLRKAGRGICRDDAGIESDEVERDRGSRFARVGWILEEDRYAGTNDEVYGR